MKLEIKSARTTYAVEVGDFATAHLTGHRLFIADRRVLELHPRVRAMLAGEQVLEVDALETNKNLAFGVDTILPFLLEHKTTRASTVVAIGGGIVQDLVAFVCSLLFRGVRWSFYPTTLLAQADSCIGSKTSLNHDKFKNLLGTFFPPQRIVLDAAFLKTLAPLDHTSGIGEIIKVHLLDSAQASSELAGALDGLFARNDDVVSRFVVRSLEIKKRFVEIDEYDEGPRLVLNYGHCVGHALEAATDYAIPHGIAVMYGMAVANRLSARREWISAATCTAMNRLIEPKLPLRDAALRVSWEAMLAAMRRDKKNIGGKLVVIATRGFGKMERMIDVDPDDIHAAWDGMMKELT